MPSFDPQTPVARHGSHTLYGGWQPGATTAPVLYCRDCFIVLPDPLILEPCVKKPHRSVVERWLAAQYEIVPENPWRPIDTAPRDGREVILRVKARAGSPGRMLVGHFMPGGFCIEDHPAIDRGWYFWNGSIFDVASEPTHWMPLPKPPEA